MATIESLNSMQMDALKEIGNIGSGNAATSLASILNCSVKVAVPGVRALDYNEAVNFLGGAENIVMGLLIRIDGEFKGTMLYILSPGFVSAALKELGVQSLDDIFHMSEMERSAICEIGNIMAGSYIGALADFTGFSLSISVPLLCVDMAGAILSVPAVEFAAVSDKVLFINDHFTVGDEEIQNNMILIPELNSFERLFSRLGIEKR